MRHSYPGAHTYDGSPDPETKWPRQRWTAECKVSSTDTEEFDIGKSPEEQRSGTSQTIGCSIKNLPTRSCAFPMPERLHIIGCQHQATGLQRTSGEDGVCRLHRYGPTGKVTHLDACDATIRVGMDSVGARFGYDGDMAT